MEGHPLPPTKEGDHPQNLRNSQEYEDNYRSLNDGGNILSLPGNLRNSQEYEEEQNALAGRNTNTGRNLRNSQEYEGLPPTMEGGILIWERPSETVRSMRRWPRNMEGQGRRAS